MPPHGPSPALFFETINAFQRTEALRAAIELDLFTQIASGLQTVEQLASACGAAPRGVRILADYLVIAGFLHKAGDRYELTADSQTFLTPLITSLPRRGSRVPADAGVAGLFRQTHRRRTEGWHGRLERGDSVARQPDLGSVRPLDGAIDDAPSRVARRALGQRPQPTAPRTGCRCRTWPLRNHFRPPLPESPHHRPGLAERPGGGGRERPRAGVADRHTLLPGSAFEVDWGGPYDLVLLTNFLHHFDLLTCEQLASKAFNALASGGRCITLEFVPDADRVNPPPTAGFALTMLATTAAGDAYTFAEYQRMFAKAGFSSSEFHPLPPTTQQAVVSNKA